MELCMGVVNGVSMSVVSVNPSPPSRSLLSPRNPISLHPFTSLRPPSSLSRQFQHLQPPPLSRSAVPASPSSSTAVSDDKDQLPADIIVTETREPNSRVKLSIQVPPEVCDDCYKRVMAEFMKQAKVPGFRPGKKVPESILVSHVGKRSVNKATVESILRRTLPHAMSSMTGTPLRDSVRIVTRFPEMEQIYSTLNSLRYEVIVDIAPELKWTPEEGYKNLKVAVELDSDIDAQKASEQELRQRHKSLGALRIVTDRGLQIGDLAVLDISATTIDQDEANVKNIPSAESKGYHFDTEDGDKVVPGFLESIIGIQQGETKSFPLVFPESWTQEELQGVHAQFNVECKELFYRDLPELDDSLAERLLPGGTTLKQVKEVLLQKFQEMEQTAREQAADNAILDQLCKMVEVDIPQSFFEEQGRQLYGAKLLEIQANVKLNDEQLASLSSKKAVDEYLLNQKENITNMIKQSLAVGDIYKRENFQISTEEIVKEVENSIDEFKRQKQDYDEERVRGQVQEILEGAKVLEWLREHAEIQYVTR
ncbi:trigger factor-like protein TIG, Chloroplastic [Pyrus communis]|uniref:trigger factor-like protein TIG, Chloroplastic n=1 Tax=Pyrus communis TaxID=23211 RepID=UPI0035C0EAC2